MYLVYQNTELHIFDYIRCFVFANAHRRYAYSTQERSKLIRLFG